VLRDLLDRDDPCHGGFRCQVFGDHCTTVGLVTSGGLVEGIADQNEVFISELCTVDGGFDVREKGERASVILPLLTARISYVGR
jgi:hypothetical protein